MNVLNKIGTCRSKSRECRTAYRFRCNLFGLSLGICTTVGWAKTAVSSRGRGWLITPCHWLHLSKWNDDKNWAVCFLVRSALNSGLAIGFSLLCQSKIIYVSGRGPLIDARYIRCLCLCWNYEEDFTSIIRISLSLHTTFCEMSKSE